MANIREILTEWTTPAGSGFRSVMYFFSSAAVGGQREALETFWDACSTSLDTGTTWTVQTSGRELESADGGLLGAWSDATARTGGGAVSGNCVPDASQALMRWTTGEIFDGRFLKGRTFIPGFSTAAVLEGNVLPANKTAIEAGTVDLLDALVQMVIWGRPKPAKPDADPPKAAVLGVANSVEGASLWEEFAVLRQRRN